MWTAQGGGKSVSALTVRVVHVERVLDAVEGGEEQVGHEVLGHLELVDDDLLTGEDELTVSSGDVGVDFGLVQPDHHLVVLGLAQRQGVEGHVRVQLELEQGQGLEGVALDLGAQLKWREGIVCELLVARCTSTME